jgi:hypothetical protein
MSFFEHSRLKRGLLLLRPLEVDEIFAEKTKASLTEWAGFR